MITSQDVAVYFGALWPYYVAESVQVELVPRVKGTPMRASIAWDAGNDRWHILGDSNLPPQALLQSLFHELGHVVKGHIGHEAGDLDYRRRLMLGQAIPGWVKAAIEQKAADQVHVKGMVEEEQAAEWWGQGEVIRWWPILASWENGEKAAKVARWALDEQRKMEAK